MKSEIVDEIIERNRAEYEGTWRQDISSKEVYCIYKLYKEKVSEDDYTILCDLGKGKRVYFSDVPRGTIPVSMPK